MTHDPALLEQLSRCQASWHKEVVYRATGASADPLAPSGSGGRWAPRGEVAVLYTSTQRDGALAEVSFHWSHFTPPPSKPVALHQIAIEVDRIVRLTDSELLELGVEPSMLATINYSRTQEIGAAAAFLGYNGLIVPSARWKCENLILFSNDHDLERSLELLSTETVEWQEWAKANGFLS